MTKAEILKELSELLTVYGIEAEMFGEITDDFDIRKAICEKATRRKIALQRAMLMVFKHYEKELRDPQEDLHHHPEGERVPGGDDPVEHGPEMEQKPI